MSNGADPARSATIRPASTEDFDGISAVWKRAGFSGLDPEKFAHLFLRNPANALGMQRGAEQIGWVVESGGSVHGVFGNLLTEYDLDGRTLLAATTSAVAVDAGFRAQAMPLVSRFFRQRGVDLLLATTANGAVSPIYLGFRAQWVPHPDYQTVHFWLVDRVGFVRSALRKRGRGWASPLAPLVGAGLWIQDLSRRSRRASIGGIDEVASFGPEFDEFWARLCAGPRRLRANRSASRLEWHFAPGQRDGGLRILVRRSGGRLEGYCILLRIDSPEIDLRRTVIADLQASEGRNDVVLELLAAARRACADDAVHVLEARGFEPAKRGALLSTRPRSRTSAVNPFMYKAVDGALSAVLQDPSVWDPCPYDGDAAI
jgi:hypothetical protein